MPLGKLKRNLMLIALLMGVTLVVYLAAGLVIGRPHQEITLMPDGIDVSLYVLIVLFIPLTIAILKVKARKATKALRKGAENHEGIASAVILSGVTCQIPALLCLIYVVTGHTPDPLYMAVTMGSCVVLLGIVPEIEHYVRDADALLPRE